MKRFSSPPQRILGIGNALLDTLVRLPGDHLLQQTGLAKGCMTLIDEEQCRLIVKKTAVLKRTHAMGGSAANACRGIASLGMPCGYIGKVGKDDAGGHFRRDLERQNIHPQLLRSDLPSGRCISLITPDGERTMATYLGAAADLAEGDFAPAMLRNYDYLHIEGYLVQNQAMIQRALQLAKEYGLCVSLDLSSPNIVAANLKFLRELTSNYVDIILANEEEAMAFTKTDSAREALPVLASYCKIAVIKLGCNGSLISYQHTRYLIPAHPAERVDTTGAGDLYAAGFLYSLARGLGLETCGKIATLLAAKVIEIVGAVIPPREWRKIRAAVHELEG